MISRIPIKSCITIDSIDIKSQVSVKLLGVEIDQQLKFNLHISNICKKVGKQISVLGRLSRTLSVKGKLVLFNSFILSHFNYCPLVWNFCSLADITKIEKLQKRALQFVYYDFDSTYAELREKSNKPLCKG